MTQTPTVVLEWTFTPADYFGQSVLLTREDYVMAIDTGKATATVVAMNYDANPSMCAALHEVLNARFLAAQLHARRPYTLLKPSLTRIREDGGRDIFVELEPAVLRISAGSVGVLITDASGNVITDSNRDRAERERRFVDMIGAHSADGLLIALLNSHRNSVGDPDNELIHLYEIRDALSQRFGDEAKTRTAPQISKADWSRFGRLCNEEPLRQGRHRGKTVGALRDATESELQEAGDIARSMIEGYVRSL